MYGIRANAKGAQEYYDSAWHYEKYANMWRITDDFWDDWELLKEMFARCEIWQNHVSAGSFPDCDMLPVGWIGKEFLQERQTNFTREEQKTMLTLWCIFGSPLMIGAELTKLDAWTLKLLTNEKILKLLSYEYQGKQIERCDSYAIWSCFNRKMGELFAALFQFREEGGELCVSLTGIEEATGGNFMERTVAEELWTKEKAVITDGELRAWVGRHDVKIFAIQQETAVI